MAPVGLLCLLHLATIPLSAAIAKDSRDAPPRASPHLNSLPTMTTPSKPLPTPTQAPTRAAPEAATGTEKRKLVLAKHQMVVSANAHATRAGIAMLRAGGSAADAAIAVQLVLGLVEPQSSGLGGGAFALYWDAEPKILKTYDGREMAPAAAKPDRFIDYARRRDFWGAVFGGLSVGVPGTLRLLERLHQNHGKLPWVTLFGPAIKLANNGFAVSPRLHKMLKGQGLRRFGDTARAYFFDPSGAVWPVGHKLKNPAYAETLRKIASRGANAFYQGTIADKIITALRNAPNHQSDMVAEDLASYEVKERPPICVTYRRHKVCGMGPPSSGALTVGQILKLIAPFDLGNSPATAMNTNAVHIIAEAQKLAFADRARYMADVDFVPVPARGLLHDGYLAKRRKLVNPRTAMTKAKPGLPPGVGTRKWGADKTIENKGTSHFSIIDQDGNAISMTTTIETAFGSRIMAAGFLLNNELTDFSFVPFSADGHIVANAIQGGKRPRSSMAPTIVFDDVGDVKALIGSSGGSRIINYVLKTLIAIVDWRMDAQAAVSLANFGSRGGPVEIENIPNTAAKTLGLLLLGQTISFSALTSGTHAILRQDGFLQGGADPRREGLALGD